MLFMLGLTYAEAKGTDCGVQYIVFLRAGRIYRSSSIAKMAYRGLRTRLLGVVVGAATVEGMCLAGRSSCLRMMSPSSLRMTGSVVDADRYAKFIKEKVWYET